METTKIAGRDVPIKPGPKTIITFSGGRGGPSEASRWEFWKARGPAGGVTARCREGEDPGKRFRDMDGAPGYESSWATARVADHLRPATAKEMEAWLNDNSKGKDAPHAESGEVGGMKVRVVESDGRYRVVFDTP